MRLTSPGRVRACGAAGIAVSGLAAIFAVYTSRSMAQSSGLVAAYSFDEGAGTTVADLSGNRITGTIVGAAWTVGRYGRALSFNGSSYVNLGNPAALQLTGSMTIEAWINAAANPADDGQIVSKSGDIGWQFKTSTDTGPHTFGIQVSPTSTSHTQRYSTTVRSLNTWYHVAGVYDATARTLSTYVNGAVDNGVLNGTVPASQFNQSVNVNIGRRSDGFYFNGVIDEVRIYNRALAAAEIQSDMNTPLGSQSTPDTTPPTVSLTAPLDGASVTGTTTLAAAASDDVGVAGVQFALDGANLGSEVAAAPFTLPWNTATASTGTHTIAAIARDFAGNTARTPTISVTVTRASRSQVGEWSAVANWPIVAVHAMLLPTGNVLAWTDYTDNGGAQIWRPATNSFTPKTYSPVSLFCAGHAFMPDGRLLVTGGIVGLQDDLGPHETTIFNPATESWSAGALMVTGRYYPTTTTLGDGRLLVLGGTTTCSTCVADTPEIYNPASNAWTQLATSSRMSFRYYPHAYVLPDGRVLVAAQDDAAISSKVLDFTTQRWTVVDSRVLDGHSSAMYRPGRIVKAGKATVDDPGHSAVATTYVLDMTRPSPLWRATASMAFPRSFLNLTVLADGQVLATGGGTTTDPANFASAVYEAELWSLTTETWTTMSQMQTPRLYHSTALLLPDARVLVAGGGRQNGRSQPDPADQPNAEIFSPPYLFKGPRPVISSAPSLLQYGAASSVTTPDAARIASVSLIALSAVTHAFNENQRFVPLTFEAASGSLTVHAPVDGNMAPPGPYMLFIVDSTGVPSLAAMVRLPAPSEDAQPPSAPGNLIATTSTAAATLTWSASTDNVGVTGYSVYRSQTSGFVPGAANRIAQAAGTTYRDANFSQAGNYYYLVTAQDAVGNQSAPSNEAFAAVSLDTTAPSVSLTAPTQGATLSGTVAATASSTDDVAVAGVQFLLDGNDLGAEVSGPGPSYTINWNTASTANGPHSLSARARDTSNNTATASSVAITVSNDVTPPSVSVTSPAGGAIVTGVVTVTASASDNVAMAGVQFLLDGANLGAEVTGPGPAYSVTWNTAAAANGSHTLAARARDTSNNTAAAPNVGVTVSNVALQGLLVAYEFNEGAGTTTADSSGHGIIGTLSGTAWISGGRYGTALSFNGTNSYVDLGNPALLRGTGSMTWIAWVKATAAPAGDGEIAAKANKNTGWQLKTSRSTGSDRFTVTVSGSGANVERSSNTVRALNTWYHVAGVYNAGTRTLDIYVNGVLDNGALLGTVPGAQTVPGSSVNLGRRASGSYFNGILDDVRIYDRALSQQEIQAIMNAPLP